MYIEETFWRSTCIAFSYLFHVLPQMDDIGETRREKIYLFIYECKDGFQWDSRSFWRLTRALITTLANRFTLRVIHSYPRAECSTEIHLEVKSRGKVSENEVKAKLFCTKCSGTCGSGGAAPLIFTLSTTRMPVVRFTCWSLEPSRNCPLSLLNGWLVVPHSQSGGSGDEIKVLCPPAIKTWVLGHTASSLGTVLIAISWLVSTVEE
jgi:hypothetical protein